MDVLIVKLGATGDVVRTTTLLHKLEGEITSLTDARNTSLLRDLRPNLRCMPWEERELVRDRSYDLVINLEDTMEVASFLKTVTYRQLWGAYANSADTVLYTDDAHGWFDLSLISRHGRKQADRLKFENRCTYQELVFAGLGWEFVGEPYFLPEPTPTDLVGDVAISARAGAVWPMKNWAYYAELKQELEARGLVVNLLPQRPTLLEHLADVRNHRCLVGGDSLPMHFALGTGTRCVTLFTCTSPWEIYDYGLQNKIVSPLLGEFFYQRGNDRRATAAIGVEEVLHAVVSQLNAVTPTIRPVALK